MAKCEICSLDSCFALCPHGVCAACRVSGECDECEREAASDHFLRVRMAYADGVLSDGDDDNGGRA